MMFQNMLLTSIILQEYRCLYIVFDLCWSLLELLVEVLQDSASASLSGAPEVAPACIWLSHKCRSCCPRATFELRYQLMHEDYAPTHAIFSHYSRASLTCYYSQNTLSIIDASLCVASFPIQSRRENVSSQL